MSAAPEQPTMKLRFLARGSAMVPHYESQESGTRRFHGWKHDATIGPKFPVLDELGRSTGESKHHGGFVKQLGQIISVGVRSRFAGEYIRHLKDGDLWPADAFTARFCGVKFDPTFGGEHTSEAQANQEQAIAAARAILVSATADAAIEATAPVQAPTTPVDPSAAVTAAAEE